MKSLRTAKFMVFEIFSLYGSHIIEAFWIIKVRLDQRGLDLPCGSIIKGHLLELDTTIPLSMEKESTGSPAMCQALILTGSPSVALTEKFLEHKIFLSLHIFNQSLIHSYRQGRMNTNIHTISQNTVLTHISKIYGEGSQISYNTS